MKFKVMCLTLKEINNIYHLIQIFLYRPKFSMEAQDILDLEWQHNLKIDCLTGYGIKHLIDQMVKDGLINMLDDGAHLTLRGMWFAHSLETSFDFILLKESHKLIE